MLAAHDYPPWEFLIFAIAILISLIGKVVEVSKRVRQKSIEAETQEERQFGAELQEAPEPRRVQAPPPRLELARRPPRPRREPVIPEPFAPPAFRLPPPLQPSVAETVGRRSEHPFHRMLRAPHGAKNAIVLAEILGRPKALRRPVTRAWP